LKHTHTHKQKSETRKKSDKFHPSKVQLASHTLALVEPLVVLLVVF
jgi:hypothetical protein